MGEEATFQDKLEVLQQQQDLIDEEAEQEQVRLSSSFSSPLSTSILHLLSSLSLPPY
jgi:hypothetical protein